MTGLLDNQEIELPCENCGRKTKKTVGWIKTNKQFTCACGTNIAVNSDQFRREMGKVDDALKSLQDTLKGLSK